MADDLNEPLRGRRAPRQREFRPILAIGLIGTAGALVLVAGMWVALVDDPLGGQPIAVATVQNAAPATTGSLAGRPAADTNAAQAPDHGDIQLASAPHMPLPPPLASAPEDMLEPSAFGPLPKISANGLRPLDAYRGAATDAGTGAPRVAIVVGGLGLSQTGTQRAVEILPEGVTLAFAPYGGSLQRWVDKAREKGHEVLLQIPMEPVNYPEVDPGEHTLLASADPASNDRDLQWALARVTSYAGVMNYMGARFTAEYDALAGFLGNLTQRGLFYLDDGSSPGSLAKVAGMELAAPVVVADAIVDLDRDPGRIEEALLQLESKARESGIAVGVATGFAASVAAITAWAPAAESRGVVLVPASAALRR